VVFSSSSTNKTYRHDITEILLTVALDNINLTNKQTNKQSTCYIVAVSFIGGGTGENH
jgi:hypothetical protein